MKGRMNVEMMFDVSETLRMSETDNLENNELDINSWQMMVFADIGTTKM